MYFWTNTVYLDLKFHTSLNCGVCEFELEFSWQILNFFNAEQPFMNPPKYAQNIIKIVHHYTRCSWITYIHYTEIIILCPNYGRKICTFRAKNVSPDEWTRTPQRLSVSDGLQYSLYFLLCIFQKDRDHIPIHKMVTSYLFWFISRAP